MSVPVRSVAFMRSRQHIPADLAQRAPGPELAAGLAGIDSARLTGFDAVQVLAARYRQLNHEQARYLELMAEVGRCDEPDSLTRCEPGEFAAEEARVALGLTRRRADDEFWFADDLVRRLSAVHAAMLAGNCDRPRAWIFCEWTKDVAPEQARAIVDRLLPRVVRGELTTGQLIEQLKRAAIAVDPDWARRRYERALGERKVIGPVTRMGPRTWAATTCPSSGSPPPRSTSTIWRSRPSGPGPGGGSITCAASCFSG